MTLTVMGLANALAQVMAYAGRAMLGRVQRHLDLQWQYVRSLHVEAHWHQDHGVDAENVWQTYTGCRTEVQRWQGPVDLLRCLSRIEIATCLALAVGWLYMST